MDTKLSSIVVHDSTLNGELWDNLTYSFSSCDSAWRDFKAFSHSLGFTDTGGLFKGLTEVNSRLRSFQLEIRLSNYLGLGVSWNLPSIFLPHSTGDLPVQSLDRMNDLTPGNLLEEVDDSRS